MKNGQRDRQKGGERMSRKNILLAGINNPLGKALSESLAENYNVLGVMNCFSEDINFPEIKQIICGNFQHFCISAEMNFVIYVNYHNNSIEHFGFIVELAKKQDAKLIYISVYDDDQKPEREIKNSGLNYLILHLPEVVSKEADCWLGKTIQQILNYEDIEIDDLNVVPEFIWLDDAVDYIIHLIDEDMLCKEVRFLLARDKLTYEEILLTIGRIVNISPRVIVGNHNVCRTDGEKNIDPNFFTIGYHEMIKELLPRNYTNKLGKNQGALQYYENVQGQADTLYSVLREYSTADKADDNDIIYHKLYNLLKRHYKQIFLMPLNMAGISYLCQNMFLYIIEKKKSAGEQLNIFVPLTKNLNCFKREDIPNEWLLNKYAKRVQMVTGESYKFWQVAFKQELNKRIINFNLKYNLWNVMEREMDYRYRNFSQDFFLQFNRQEQEYAKAKLISMGVGNQAYVCFHARDNAYNCAFKGENRSEIEEENDRNRNSSIENYRMAMLYLAQKGIFSMRMGAAVETPISGNKIIDYASCYREEMLDFYLLANCRYFVCTASGIIFMTTFFSKPLILVNWPLITSNMDNMPLSNLSRDIMIPRKLWHTKEKRYLTLREQLAFEQTHQAYDIYNAYAQQGVVLQENTATEIYEAVAEMEDRLEGKCYYSQVDEELQRKYRNILMGYVQKNYLHWIDARMGRNFLRNNPWYLE